MFFHFDFANYFRMLRLAWSEKNPLARRYYLLILLFSVPLVSSFHALCFFLDGLLYPRLWQTRVEKPVFIVGHARSGTTLVHRLMSRDEGRFSSFVLYELYFPSLLQKKVIRFCARVDREHFGGRLEKRVQAWEENDRNGVLSMATGSGKTVTALIAAHRLHATRPWQEPLSRVERCREPRFLWQVVWSGQGGTERTD